MSATPTPTPTPAAPLPESDPVTARFWTSVRQGAMELQQCDACQRFIFYPRGLCPHCFSGQLTWRPVAGTGALHAFTIVYRHPHPAFMAAAPYVVAFVELAEGVRMLTNLVEIDPTPEAVRIGMPLEIVYEQVADGVTLPKFRPRG